MEKSDFIDFIHESVTTPNHSPNTRETIYKTLTVKIDEGRREKRHNEDVIVHLYTLSSFI